MVTHTQQAMPGVPHRQPARPLEAPHGLHRLSPARWSLTVNARLHLLQIRLPACQGEQQGNAMAGETDKSLHGMQFPWEESHNPVKSVNA